MLIDGSGVPLFDPTVWSISKFRHKSAATMEQALRGAMLVHLFCWRHEIDLSQRFRDGAFLGMGELDALVADAARPFATLRRLAKPTNKASQRKASVVRLLRRLPAQSQGQTLDPETTRIRLYYATSYLEWLGDRQRLRLSGGPAGELAGSHDYAARLARLVEQIEERSPSGARGGRISLSTQQRAALLAAADPNGPANPWRSEFVRMRNWVIVRWLLGTGMRRGELLGLRVRDFNRSQGYCEIRRRHDDKREVRRRQPNAKTLERLAPLDEDLTLLGERYLRARNTIETARKHGALFVTAGGKPLSDSAITEIFATLRARCPEVGPASAHVLRHQWNEDFSVYADTIGMDEDDERRERCWLMGWTPTSKMPGHYLKRRTKEKADEHVKEMQHRLMKSGAETRGHLEDMNRRPQTPNLGESGA